ncbi:MAG: AlpA family phage regulatory protein [Deltaproteobacteria bacterium]|nr:AlpA family phage regulatory protein [Deltaproteobacteria bacterium]
MIKLYLTDNEVAKRFGIARGTVWRWNREYPSFPKAVKLSPGCARWPIDEIEAYEKKQADSRG